MVTRVAPSPTGQFHLGTLRTALLNYLMARANNGTFILRIDDTDQERNRTEWIDYIYDQMDKFGLDYDITFKQSERLDRYKEVAEKIGEKTENGYELDMGGYQMVILRNNGFPTYNFSSILDDYDYDVTNIIRGVDHISNADKQELIWGKICEVEGQKKFPEITHAGLLFEGNKKLSKRTGNGTTEDYKDFSVEALLNWLIKFGWSHPDPNFDKHHKTLSMDEMISLFNEGKISNRNCKIDKNKLLFLDKLWRNKLGKSPKTKKFNDFKEGEVIESVSRLIRKFEDFKIYENWLSDKVKNVFKSKEERIKELEDQEKELIDSGSSWSDPEVQDIRRIISRLSTSSKSPRNN